MFDAPKVDFHGSQTVATATHSSDAAVYVEFSMEPFYLDARSREEGRPIYEDRPFITMMFPGDRTKKIARHAFLTREEAGNGPTDPERFPRQWDAFQRNQSQVPVGLPLKEWPPLSKSQVLELNAMGIPTVEALAAMPDSGLTFLGARELRTKAQAWIDASKGHAQESALIAENEQLKARLEALENQVKLLGDANPEKRGPGRPPKAAAA
ncbi:chromosome partitioning protein ParA [Dyella marensis]|uniref:hypothetical protein n=1 Tax=Dyella marensis TaxID=500610 RepID=UPI0031E43485